MTTISDIRAIINAKDGTTEGDAVELSDDSIEIAIDNADTYVSDLAGRSGASAEIIALAKTNHAAYLAYQTYADRIVEELPVPNATPVKVESYAAGTVIQADVGAHAGAAGNTVYLYGMLY